MSNTDESQVYELSYLILPSIPEEKVGEVVDSMKEVVSSEGGKELDGEAPFKIPLAYEMSKVVGSSRYVLNDAYLGWFKFEIDGEKALAIKTAIEKMSEVVRFLLVKAPRETHFTFAEAEARLEAGEEPTEVREEAPSVVEEPVVE